MNQTIEAPAYHLPRHETGQVTQKTLADAGGIAALSATVDEAKAADAAKRAASLPKTPEEFADRCYYEGPNRYLFDTGMAFIPLNQRRIEDRAARAGVPVVPAMLETVENERTICRSFETLAGKPRGVYSTGGLNFIVRRSLPWLEGIPGECKTIVGFLRAIFDDPNNPRQYPTFLAWMQKARQILRDSLNEKPKSDGAQVLAIVGAQDLGKTFRLKSIIAPLFGGAIGNPAQYMKRVIKGGAAFNSELIRCPLQVLDDNFSNLTEGQRRALMAAMKELIYGATVSIEGKGANTETLTDIPLFFIDIMNPDDESLSAFPIVGGDSDKLIGIMAARYRDDPLPNVSKEDKQAVNSAISAELPAFAHFIDTYTPPEDVADPGGRHGARAYVHPKLAHLVGEISPEARLLDVIDAAFRACVKDKTDSDGKTASIEDLKKEQAAGEFLETLQRYCPPKYESELGKIVTNPKRMGNLLSALASTRPERVAKRTLHGQVIYAVTPEGSPFKTP